MPDGDRERALALAYRFVNRRERTVAEVTERLRRAELGDGAVEAAVAELVEFGYLNDARYARVFTADKRLLESWAAGRIARSLRERGVDRELIQAALRDVNGAVVADDGALAGGDGIGGPVESGWDSGGLGGRGEPETELDRAVALLHQRFPAGPVARRDRERAFGVLARKGYESETAADAIRAWARATAD